MGSLITSTVFVVHDDGTKNIHPATRFGEVKVFTHRDLPIIGTNAFEWMYDLEYWLGDYDPDVDYLLLIGDPVLIAAASAYMGSRFNKFTILKWDRQEKVYIPVTIPIILSQGG